MADRDIEIQALEVVLSGPADAYEIVCHKQPILGHPQRTTVYYFFLVGKGLG